MRGGPDRLGHHLDQTLDVIAAIYSHRRGSLDSSKDRPIVGALVGVCGGNIGAITGIGQLVVVGLGDTAESDVHLLPERKFRLTLRFKSLVEELVMPEFIGRDPT